MWMSPVLHTLQFSWERTPFTMPMAPNSEGSGFLRNSFGVMSSTGTGLSIRDISFMVPVTTTSSRSWAEGSRARSPRSVVCPLVTFTWRSKGMYPTALVRRV